MYLSVLRHGKIFLNFDYFMKILEMMSPSSGKAKFRQVMNGAFVDHCCYCQETKILKYF